MQEEELEISYRELMKRMLKGKPDLKTVDHQGAPTIISNAGRGKNGSC